MKVDLLMGGQSYSVQTQENQTILEALLENNINAPYACESGSCATCKAELIQGQVDMIENNALDDDELDQNLILNCQAIPKTDCSIQINEA